MSSENVYVVTCYHLMTWEKGTEVVRIFKSQTDANEHARACLDEHYGDDWKEYEDTAGSDGSMVFTRKGLRTKFSIGTSVK